MLLQLPKYGWLEWNNLIKWVRFGFDIDNYAKRLDNLAKYIGWELCRSSLNIARQNGFLKRNPFPSFLSKSRWKVRMHSKLFESSRIQVLEIVRSQQQYSWFLVARTSSNISWCRWFWHTYELWNSMCGVSQKHRKLRRITETFW